MEFSLYAGALAGLILIVIGWRGRRIDDRPYCRRCRHCLSGADRPGVCPECGCDVRRPRGVRLGARRRRPVVLLLGVLLFLGGAGSGGGVSWTTRVAGRDSASLKPTWWLQLEVRWSDAQGTVAALRELDRRMLAGELSDAVLLELAQRGLDLQADEATPWVPEWGNFIEGAWHAGVLDDTALDRYVDQATTPYLCVRYEASTGLRYRVFIAVPAPRWAAESVFTFVAWIESAEIDGRPVRIVDSTQVSRGFGPGHPATSLSARALCDPVASSGGNATVRAVGRFALTTPIGGVSGLEPDQVSRARRSLRSTPLSMVRGFGAGWGQRGGTGVKDVPRAPIVYSRTVSQGRDGALVLEQGPFAELEVRDDDRATMAQAFAVVNARARPMGGSSALITMRVVGGASAPGDFAFRVVLEAGEERSVIGGFTSDDKPLRGRTIQGFVADASWLSEVDHDVRVVLEPDPGMVEIPPTASEIWGERIDLGMVRVTVE